MKRWRLTIYLVPPETARQKSWPPLYAYFDDREEANTFAKDVVEVGPAAMVIGPEDMRA